MTLHSFLVLLAFLAEAVGVQITHYGYPGDLTPDSNSSQGIGAFSFDSAPGSLNSIGALRAVALSPDVAQQYKLQPGQSFNVQVAGGQTISLVYADVVPSVNPYTGQPETGRIDVFDPNNQIGSLDGAQVIAVAGGPVLASDQAANFGSAVAQTINIQIVDPILSKFKEAAQAWVGPLTRGATTLFWILALISLCWTGSQCSSKAVDCLKYSRNCFASS